MEIEVIYKNGRYMKFPESLPECYKKGPAESKPDPESP